MANASGKEKTGRLVKMIKSIKNQEGIALYQCTICKATFGNRKEARLHVMSEHF